MKAWRGASVFTKSGLMLGLGETDEEISAALQDLRQAGCDILTWANICNPPARTCRSVSLSPPLASRSIGELARRLGFIHVASGPMVRSSYHADEFAPPV